MNPPTVTESPEFIWLQYGEIEQDCTHAECYRLGDVTWCEDAQFDSDVRYVRADIYKAQADELDRLRAANARQRAWIDGVMGQERHSLAVVPYAFTAGFVPAEHALTTKTVELITRPAPFEDK